MSSKAELLTEIEELKIELLFKQAIIDQLNDRLRLAAATCAYCETVFMANDPAAYLHWRTCKNHPARLELERLRALVGQVTL